MGQIVEGCVLAGDDDVREQPVFGVHVRLAFQRPDHRDADVGDVFQDLRPLVMHLRPDVRIGDVPERAEVDARHEVAAGTRENDDLVAAIARDVVEGVDEGLVVLRREGQRAAVVVQRNHEDAVFAALETDVPVLREVAGLAWIDAGHGRLLSCVATRRRLLRAALRAVRSWLGSRRTWVRRRPPWMLAMVALASAAGSASLRSLPRVFMRVRPSRRCASQRSRPAAIAARAAGSLSASWPASEPIGQPPRACCSIWCWTMKSNQRSMPAQESRWSRSSPCLPRTASVVTSMTAWTRSSRSSK